MTDDQTNDSENAPVIDPGGQGTGGGNISAPASSDEVVGFAAPDDAVIDPPGQNTGGGGNITTDAPIDAGGQGTGGGQ